MEGVVIVCWSCPVDSGTAKTLRPRKTVGNRYLLFTQSGVMSPDDRDPSPPSRLAPAPGHIDERPRPQGGRHGTDDLPDREFRDEALGGAVAPPEFRHGHGPVEFPAGDLAAAGAAQAGRFPLGLAEATLRL